MKVKVERLRAGLVVGALLLGVAVVGTMGYSRYRAAKGWLNRAKQRSGVNVVRETDGFTYSQSMQGRTIFTLHAAKAFQHTDGLWTLHDVVITLYGLHDERADRVYGNEFQWDETKGIARAVGEVQMDLEVPSGLTAKVHNGDPLAVANGVVAKDGVKQSIHVRTSGLVFVRQLGVAATQEKIEFKYGGLTCVATGAEFDNSPSALHLLRDVQFNGEVRGAPATLTAMKADFDRTSNVVSLTRPTVTGAQGRGHADAAVLHLRHDGSVERAEAVGNVGLDAGVRGSENGARHVTGTRLDVVVSEGNTLQSARLVGAVRMTDDNPVAPAQGEAGELRTRFDGQGRPMEITALGGAHVLARTKAAKADASANALWLERELRAEQIVASMVAAPKGQTVLRSVHAVGQASMRGDSWVRAENGGVGKVGVGTLGVKATSVSGDDLVLDFGPTVGKAVTVNSLHGRGHTVLHQAAPMGEERTSSGDSLEVRFEQSDGDSRPGSRMDSNGRFGKVAIASAVQEGHVAISSRAGVGTGAKPKPATSGTADRAMYDGASERLTLSGGRSGDVHLADGEISLVAGTVVLDQRSGDADASGKVLATFAGSGEATHIAAQHALLHRATEVVEFSGSGEAKPARMWQEASQVEAATIVLDRQKHSLEARPGSPSGVVHSVFVQSAGAGKKPVGVGGAAAGILRVESRGIEYTEQAHEAVFAGPVRLQGATGDVRGERATVVFLPARNGVKGGAAGEALPSSGLDRVVVDGGVRLEQPGREGTGERLTYKAADGSFVLTGTPGAPPRIVDREQGAVMGDSLLFRGGDSTIVVSGTVAGVPAGAHQRAHIDTHMRP